MKNDRHLFLIKKKCIYPTNKYYKCKKNSEKVNIDLIITITEMRLIKLCNKWNKVNKIISLKLIKSKNLLHISWQILCIYYVKM